MKKLKKRMLANALALGLLLSNLTTSYVSATETSSISISDIQGHWAESQINEFVSKGYIGGYADGTIKPNNSITRGEFVTIFNRVFKLTKSGGNIFNDTQSHWAKEQIDIAVTNGICSGKSSTEFKPDDYITREEACAMIANYKKISNSNHNKLNQYDDSGSISTWAKDSVAVVMLNGYMGGYDDNTFRPKGNITRAEAVVTMSRVVSPPPTSPEVIVSGISTSITETAGKSLTNKIKVSPALGRKVNLQMLNRETNKWETKQTYTTSNEVESEINLVYPEQWYKQASSTWRVYVPPVSTTDSYVSSTINITAKRLYNNASGYIQLKDKITVESGGANLVKGTMGLRVAKVQRKLGMGHRWEIVDAATMNKVKDFQRKNGLKVTGIVDVTTWKKLGFSESSWYSLDTYVTPIKTNLASTKQDHIETMIDTAMSYLGTEYIVGAAGEPGTGIDCSGLVMQAMYSVGIDPAPVSVVRHTKPGYEFESRNLFKMKTLKHVKYSERKRGDLIFYSDFKGTIIHVAIYLGDDKVIESWPEKVVIWPIKNSQRSRIAGVARIFE